MCVLWTQIKLLTSHFSGKDYYPCFYCLKKTGESETQKCLVLLQRLSLYTSPEPVLGAVCAWRRGTQLRKLEMRGSSVPELRLYPCLPVTLPTELWTVCRTLCHPHSIAETPGVFLLMHTTSRFQVMYRTRWSAEREVYVLGFCCVPPCLAFLHLISFFQQLGQC